MKTKLLSALFVISSLSLSAQGAWTQKANFGGTGRYMPTAFAIGTKGYVGTGYSQAGQTSDFWEWNQATNIWTQIASFPTGNTAQGVGFSIGLKGYMMPLSSQQLWEYDPSINTWAQKASCGASQHNAVGFVIASKGYIGAIGTTNQVWEYDPSIDEWTQKADFGGGVREHAAGFAIGPKGYIGTGRDDSGNYNDFWEFDPSTNTWTPKTNFPGAPRDYATGFSIGSKGYMGTGGSNYADWWQYNPVTDTWTSMANIPSGGTTTAISFTIGNKGYIACGQDATGYSRALWEFDPQDSALSILSGSAFTDANTNCIMDGADASIANWYVKAQDINSTYYSSTKANGNYEIWVPTGTYTVSLIPKPYYNQVCPTSNYTATVAFQDSINNLNFGAVVSAYCPDLAVSIGTSTQRRCFTNNYYYVQYWNNGTTAANSATLTVTFDNKIIPLSSSLPWNNVSGNSYSWNLSSVQPGQYVSFSIQDSVLCNASLGDTLYVSAAITTAGDCGGENNADEYNCIIIGSYDPNAKEAVTTSNKINITQANILPTDTIDYTIHFQNTGTDTAFTVVVYDTLDTDLNIPSVINGASSHPYTMQLMGAGILKYTFSNILLPDSNISEPASHGFIKFQILQKPNNPNGTVIKNWAGIVFDFNAPVITDTVVLTVMTPISVQDVSSDENAISIYPNPFSTQTTLQTNTPFHNATLTVDNCFGQMVAQIKNISGQTITFHRDNLASGLYFVRLTEENKTIAVDKLVIADK